MIGELKGDPVRTTHALMGGLGDAAVALHPLERLVHLSERERPDTREPAVVLPLELVTVPGALRRKEPQERVRG
ncbi:hypothetical protein GCM10010170_033120 [Dactylosporangium salmoneum]|uniref:Uncharacterized protein n=1 Tax=Dactylosporangium salmoneum TaxID=53361 RepID=A0ABP5T8V9_9ACTN